MAGQTEQANEDSDTLRFGGLSIRVLGREFPGSQDYWDGNWLSVQIVMQAPGALVEVSGPILHLSELAKFRVELTRLYSTLVGVATLECIEPNFGLRLNHDVLGHIGVHVSITPDHLSQRHEFEFGLDQTYLAPLLRWCGELMERHPVRGPTNA